MKKSYQIKILISLMFFSACETIEKKKPLNVLWLVAEDLSPNYLNAYGNPRAPTPNLDRLAREGVVYTCLLYTSPSPRDRTRSRMPSSA